MIYSKHDPLQFREPVRNAPHPSSYWAATSGPQPEDEGRLQGDVEADIAVIGGGYTGLSAAHRLAGLHGARVVLLEANWPGWGCSGRNGGIARPAIGRLKYSQWIERWGRDKARAVFGESLAAFRTLKEIIADGRIDCDVQDDGYMRVAHLASRVRELEGDARLLKNEFGYETVLIDGDQLRRDYVAGAEAHGALYWPDAMGVHPLKLAFGLTVMARAAGARVYSESPVTGWTRERGSHRLRTPGGTVRARNVLLAVNGYFNEALHPGLIGRTLPVISIVGVTRPLTADEKTACNFQTGRVMSDTRNVLYFYRRLPDDRVLIGGRGPIVENPAALRRWRKVLEEMLHAKFPPLAAVTLDYFWHGWVCLSFDSVPHIHRLKDDRSVHYAMGYCGSGVTTAVHFGRRFADHLGGCGNLPAEVDTPLPVYPLAPFRRLGQRGVMLWYALKDRRS